MIVEAKTIQERDRYLARGGQVLSTREFSHGGTIWTMDVPDEDVRTFLEPPPPPEVEDAGDPGDVEDAGSAGKRRRK